MKEYWISESGKVIIAKEMSFNQFPDYQSLEENTKGADGKANRSIPDRVKEYNLLDIVKPHFDVLDIGCNRGYFGVVLSPHINSYTGIESDENQLREGLKLKPSNSTLIHSKYYKQDRKFHLILCLAVHSYIDMDMEKFANDLVDMLHPGGFLFIESHPPGYREEPEKYFYPLINELTKHLSHFEYQKIKDRELVRELFTLYKGKSGSTALIDINDNVVTKTYLSGSYFTSRSLNIHFRNEAWALAVLNGLKHFPVLKKIDYDNKVIVMEYAGEPITEIPEDFAHQAWEMEEIMKRENVYHLDIEPKNILIKDGIITLIDWGLSTNKPNEYVNKISNYVQPE